MHVEALSQCDAKLGTGTKALFPGQRYELPDEIAAELVVAGKVRELKTAREVLVPQQQSNRIAGRPSRRK
ncbi:MAG TPA: hypothetical protein PLQ71_13375 [Nitrospira sp.]|jgi:hypothetical protein|nr:hypothetical protein [Nitrospira sp.]